ncbi:uncharacterized protein DS421_6g190780 [Arachis hypogaea]|nr:uncharacterized protein DS421_6g190780 [Arachis hypogaea]
MLICDHYMPPDPYNPIVEGHLRETGFYYVSQIGVVQCQSALVNALIERWRPETHTFHFPIGECYVTLEDVAVIFGLPTNGLPVTGPTMSSYEALEVECLHHFGVAPRKTECRGSFVKLTWFRRLKEHIVLDNDIQVQKYVKCHIMLLFGTIMFGDKSAAGVHWKFLPLLRNFGGIREFSWGSACLAHLYRALCRATRVNCKEIDGPLTLLLTWAWIRLPFLSPIPGNPRVFPLANRWRNWDRDERAYRYHSLAHYRRVLDDLQEGQFVWEAYAVERIEAGLIPANILHHSVIWSATVPLISFECIEWHASDRLRRQFGLSQGVPQQERNLGHAHGEVLNGPKNEDWSDVHSFWVMQWMNRYSHILSDPLVPLHSPLDIYMQWYRGAYGAHLQLTDLAFQENLEGHPADHQENQLPPPSPPPPPPPVSQPETQEAPQSYIPQSQPADYFTPSVPLHQQYWGVPYFDSGEQASFSQLLGFMAPQDPSGLASGRMSLDSRARHHTSSSHSGGRHSIDSSRSEVAMGGVIQSGNPRRIPMSLIHESNKAAADEADDYLVDRLDDEDDDDDDDDDEDEDEDEDEEGNADDTNGDDDSDGNDPAPSAGTATSQKGKGYDLRTDPPC